MPIDTAGKLQQPEDFMTGFIINEAKTEVHGRPVGISVTPNGGLLICDDDAGIVCKVSAG